MMKTSTRIIFRASLVAFIVLLMMASTLSLMQRIWVVESTLRVKFKDPQDSYIYPKELKGTYGTLVKKSDVIEWHEMSTKSFEAKRQEYLREAASYRQLANDLKEKRNAEYAPLQEKLDRVGGLTSSEWDKFFGKNILGRDEQKAWSKVHQLQAALKKFENRKTFSEDKVRRKNVDGLATQRMVKSGSVWRWVTERDESYTAQISRWLDRRRLGQIRSNVTQVQVGTARTTLYIAFVTYLLQVGLIMGAGVLAYRRLRGFKPTDKGFEEVES